MNRWVESFRSPDFDPEYIVTVASGKLRERNKPMSPKGAIALALQDLGRSKLNEVLEPILRSNNAVQLSLGDIVGRMKSDDQKAKFFIGFGSVLLGGIISALEDCVVDGWDYEYLTTMLNRGLWGTPIAKFEKKDFLTDDPNYKGLTLDQETDKIRRVLKEDGGTFIGFFEPNNSNLPGGLRFYLDKTRNYFLVDCALPFYKEAIKAYPKK